MERMIVSNQVLRNAAAASSQALVSGLLLFCLYKYLLATIGVEKVGIWSTVLATTTMTRLTELGLTGSVVKFVAKYRAYGDQPAVVSVVETAIISIGLGIGLAGLLLLPVISYALKHVMDLSAYAVAAGLLPYAILSLWMNSVCGVVQGALDGCQRADKRSLVTLFSNFAFVAAVPVLVPKHGLLGLAYAQIGQGIIVLVVTWYQLRKHVIGLRFLRLRWSGLRFREMFRYGLAFQASTLAQLAFDPVTKALLSKFGGLTSVGYYEMASRMVTQVRALIVSANQVVVPLMAEMKESAPEQIHRVYLNNYRAMVLLCILGAGALIALAPMISILWIGKISTEFVTSVFLLTIGWTINTLTVPAFFANQGLGNLGINTVSSFGIAMLNVVLGVALGWLFAGTGVVLGWALALAIGSAAIPVEFHRQQGLSLRLLIPLESRHVLVVTFITVALCLMVYVVSGTYGHPVAGALVMLLIFPLGVCIPIWNHPLRNATVAKWTRTR